jgi:SHS2 domain-containing protein
MTYRYLEDVATADIAFEATGASIEDLFISCADATLNVMIEDIASIVLHRIVSFKFQNDQVDMLLFDLLQEIIFYKDAEQLLLRIQSIRIDSVGGQYILEGEGAGEKLDSVRHLQRVDVKAVTLYKFTVEQTAQGQWRAIVILDV